MASKVLSRRLVASLSVLGLLLSSLLVIAPMTAPAVEQPNVGNSSSTDASTSSNNHSAKPSANSNRAAQGRLGNTSATPLNFMDPSAGVPQALRGPIPVRGGAPK